MTTPQARALRRRMTDAELALWSHLRMKQVCDVKFRRQQPVGPYIVDFVSFEARLIIEIDGGQHAEEANARDDAVRTMYLESRGFKVIRFWNFEVLGSLDAVLESIAACIDSGAPSP